MWALVVEMLMSPLADTHPRAGALLGLVVLSILLSGIGYMANAKVVRRMVLPVAAVWMVARIMEAFGDRSKPYANLSPVVGLIFSCSVLWAIFGHFRSRSGNPRSAIAECFISYLVIATAFSQVYWILNRYVDHAFNQVIPSAQSGTFLYFSMITVTSVGYGGIVPVNPYVRNVAAFESMSGIFFVAVVVARLVSSYSQKPAERSGFMAHEANRSTGGIPGATADVPPRRSTFFLPLSQIRQTSYATFVVCDVRLRHQIRLGYSQSYDFRPSKSWCK
jgi:voltage-gated potassium channel